MVCVLKNEKRDAMKTLSVKAMKHKNTGSKVPALNTPLIRYSIEQLIQDDNEHNEYRPVNYEKYHSNNPNRKVRRSRSLAMANVNRKRLMRRMSESFIPSCVS
jgi:hypothetical protein